ncbi:MAG: hypothetical protein KatS3mg110_0685 [Pirellulaceae bacterium]|nr:MAG: hypothetical protein KatS3mg110_0685 [Pirellulaceae bacterium]
MDFDNQPLTEVAQILSDDTQIQIWLDKKALNEAAIPTDKSITVHLRGRVRTILDLICQEQDLDYYIRDNILILTTPEEAERKMDTRIYPVQEVLDRLTGLYQPLSGSTWGCPAVMPGTAPRPGASSPVPANNDQSQAIEPTGSISVSFDGQVQVPSGSVPRQAGEVPIFQPAETGRQSAVNPLPGGDPRATSPQGACPTCCFPPAVMPASGREAAVQALIDTLTASVEPDSWDINGGNAFIMELGGVLVVSQTERGHREFAEVLASLRSAIERNADHKEQLP